MTQKEIYSKLNSYLSENGLKSTKQRDAIVEAFLKHKEEHVTIEEVLESARKINDSIGYATVYRTLLLLVDAEIAHQRHFKDGQSRFELRGEHHDHLICTDCGKIIEFENDTIEKLQEKIAKDAGLSLTHHKLELYGRCQKLESKGKCPNYKAKK